MRTKTQKISKKVDPFLLIVSLLRWLPTAAPKRHTPALEYMCTHKISAITEKETVPSVAGCSWFALVPRSDISRD